MVTFILGKVLQINATKKELESSCMLKSNILIGGHLMPKPRFNKFYRYDELTQLLKAYVKEYPKLFKLESIGKSYKDPMFG